MSLIDAYRIYAIFLKIGEIGMTRSWIRVHCAATVILGSVIFIPHNHGNWRSKRDAEFCAGLNLDSVLFDDVSSEAGYLLL
jgi:hypothetical protein